MKFLVRFALLMLVGVAVVHFALNDTGYVLISRDPWIVETSLVFFVVALLVVFTTLYYVLRFGANLLQVSRRLQSWQVQRRARRARRALTRGLIDLAERNWQTAERRLMKYVQDSDTPLLNYLAAASAAQGQNAHERRDHYLNLAHQSMPAADIAVGLTQAELQMRHRQMEQALATLTHLRQLAPRHTHVLKLLMRLYVELNDWRHLETLLPELHRRRVVDEADFHALEHRVHQSLLTAAFHSGVREVIHDTWSRMPKRLRNDPDILGIYVTYLITQDDAAAAEKLVRDALQREWNEDLARLYGAIEIPDANRQLSIAERWLPAQETSPALLLTLGWLSGRAQLWGKARSYLEASIRMGATPESYKTLGDLLTSLGETDTASECYHKGLALALVDSAAVRRPDEQSPVAALIADTQTFLPG